METLLGFELSLVGYKEVKTKFKGIIDILHFLIWVLGSDWAFSIWDAKPTCFACLEHSPQNSGLDS